MAHVGKAATTLTRQARRDWRTALIAWSLIPVTGVLLLYLLVRLRTHHLYVLGLAVASLVMLPWLIRRTESFANSRLCTIAGHGGERRAFEQLQRLPDDYWIFNDVQLRVGRSRAQIDHVLVCPYGVWCIETKSHVGLVSGAEEGPCTQIKESERGKRYPKTIANPISQNASHRQTLSAYLKASVPFEPPIKCLIVFTRALVRADTVTPVVGLDEVARSIQGSDTKPCLQPEQVQRIVEALQTDRAEVAVTTLYVGSLGDAATDSQIWALFESFDPVAVRLQSGKGFGFVDVPEDKAAAARAALNARLLNGRAVKVNDDTRHRRGNPR